MFWNLHDTGDELHSGIHQLGNLHIAQRLFPFWLFCVVCLICLNVSALFNKVLLDFFSDDFSTNGRNYSISIWLPEIKFAWMLICCWRLFVLNFLLNNLQLKDMKWSFWLMIAQKASSLLKMVRYFNWMKLVFIIYECEYKNLLIFN